MVDILSEVDVDKVFLMTATSSNKAPPNPFDEALLSSFFYTEQLKLSV